MRGLPGNVSVGVAIAVVALALIITVVIFVTLVEKKKAPRSRFLRWLREFLNFRSILIAGLIKFFYLFLATLITIGGIVVMFMGEDDTVLTMIGIGFAVIVFGNISLRIIMEGIMVMIGLWENTNDMRAVLVRPEEMPEPKEPKQPKEPEMAEVAQPEAAQQEVVQQEVVQQEAVQQEAVQQEVTQQEPEAAQ